MESDSLDIYHQIWDADQAGNGIQAILPGQAGYASRGQAGANGAAGTKQAEASATDLSLPSSANGWSIAKP
ncbi:hypothetical protein CU103_19755 [Phyllobacterium sophorae]|uniref:Uncharacterized protein n=1 Tax=Phyllobacterium sophorae TaxID=1520277 RepID=A0A2P7B6P3_9HYPH|nr:hypothetical protein CU103_19755 [Phyllobacterium sophorae]